VYEWYFGGQERSSIRLMLLQEEEVRLSMP
jgi:hypothetical protein